jgi:flavin reductase (DIM6/NTAB) family NADH-FMN oxidoreductase RutF
MKSLSVSDLDRSATYRLLSGLIVPRPIAWVSTQSLAGVRNLAAFSFFTVVSADPPMIGMSLNMTKSRGLKDTYVNIHETGEFVVNVVDQNTVSSMDASSDEYPADVDEFDVVKVTPAYDTLYVKAPRVAESPAQFECVHERTVDFGEYNFVVGKIVAFHLRDGLSNEQLRVNFDDYKWVGRLTGAEYCSCTPGFKVNGDF